MNTELNWKEPVTISDLPPQGKEYELVPDIAARAELAERAGVLAVQKLIAKLEVRPQGKAGAEVRGLLQATVRQNCVVTLEPFDNYIEEKVLLFFEPEEAIAAAKSLWATIRRSPLLAARSIWRRWWPNS